MSTHLPLCSDCVAYGNPIEFCSKYHDADWRWEFLGESVPA